MTELKALLFVHLFVQAFLVKFDLVPAWNFHPSGWKETDNLEILEQDLPLASFFWNMSRNACSNKKKPKN